LECIENLTTKLKKKTGQNCSELLMQILVINGSARKEKGYLAMVLEPFMNGMREAGAEVDLLYSEQLNVKPCIGDFSCWYGNPGKCHINDTMQSIYPKLKEVDVLVLGIPVYFPLPGAMQNLLNRFMPLMNPILKYRNGHTQIQFHDDVRIKKVVLVSVCGWWEKGNFDTVTRIAEEICQKASVEFAGAVLRPHADLLPKKKDEANKVFEALWKVGFSLVKKGVLPKYLLEIIAEPLISEKESRQRLSK
jgi:multimeric flavodoxin WrbA